MSIFDQIAQQQPNQGGGSTGGGGDTGGGGFSWQNFLNQRYQLQQANQQLGYNQDQNIFTQGQNDLGNPYQNQSIFAQNQNIFNDRQNNRQEEEKPKYRQMTDLERFSAQARKLSDDINNGLGNFLFGSPDNPLTGEVGQQGVFGKPQAGADLGAISLENAPRMLANVPGMIIGSVPDIASYGSELIAGTPAQEGNLETGEIEDRKLTPEETGADVLYGGLSALSFIPGVGAEAKLAGAGLKGVGKVTGSQIAKAAGNMAMTGEIKGAGALEKAAIQAGKSADQIKGAKWGDAAVGALSSAAVESAQEGLQTAAEDMRYHRFDLDDPNETKKRMAEGAFWGGIAGGLMGGAPGVFHAANNKSLLAQSVEDGSNVAPNSFNNFKKMEQSDWDALQHRSTSGRYTPGMRQYYDDLEKSDNTLRSNGSVNLILKTSNSRLGLQQWGVGVDDFVDAWNQGDNARSGIARSIGGSGADLAKVAQDIDSAIDTKTVDGVTFETTAQAMTAVNAKYNGKRGFEAAIEKRPGAKYTGGYGYITEFTDGRGFTCNPALVKQINADFDSDMGVLHFVTRSEKGGPLLNLDGYFGEKILSPEDAPLVDFYYTDFNKDRFLNRKAQAVFGQKIKDIFEPYAQQELGESAGNVSFEKYFTDKMIEAVKADDDRQKAMVIEEIRQTANRLKQRAIEEKENGAEPGKPSVFSPVYLSNFSGTADPKLDPKKFTGGLGAVSRLFASDEEIDKARLQQLRNEKRAITVEKLAKTVVKTLRDDDSVSDEVKKALKDIPIDQPLYAHGTIRGNGHAISTYEQIGLALYTLEKKANQPFRQHGQMGLNHAKVVGAYTEAISSLAKYLRYDVVDAIIRCSFRIARTGTTPLDAIEGLIDARIVRNTKHVFGFDTKKISSEQDFDRMEEGFIEAWDEGAEDYRIVHSIPTVDGNIPDPTAPKRNPLKDSSQVAVDAKFLQMFGDHRFGDLFEDAPEMWADYPLGDVITLIAEDNMVFGRIFANAANSNMNNIVDRLCKAHLEEKKNLHNSIYAEFMDIPLGPIRSRMKDGKIDPSDYGAITWFVQRLVDYITPEGFHYLGITDPIYFIENTEHGQLLIDDNIDIRLNAFISLLAKAKFGLIQDCMLGRIKGLNEDELSQAKANAIQELKNQYIGRPGVQGRIASELIEGDGQSNTLEYLMSLDDSFSSKNSQFETAFSNGPGTDLLVDLLIDTNDDFTISTVSKKYRAASVSAAKYQQALFTESRDAIRQVREQIELGTLDPQMFSAAMQNAAVACKIEVSDDPYVLSIFNSLGTAITKMEKGVNPQAEAAIAEAANIEVLGSPVSYFDSITAYVGGAVPVDNFANNPRLFLSVMSGEQKVRVSFGDRTRVVDRDWVFSQVSDTYNPKEGPNAFDWLSFLERFPQYESYFAGVVAQPITSGGEGSATVAKTGNIVDIVENYREAVSSPNEGDVDTVVEKQAEHALMIARNTAMRDGRFGVLAIHCMKDLADPGNATMSSIRGDFSNVSRRLIRSILYEALNETGIEGDTRVAKLRRATRASVIRDNFDTIQDMYDDAYDALETYGRDLFDFKEQITEIQEAANRDRFAKSVAQDCIDEIRRTHQLKDGIEVKEVVSDGELSAGELDLLELELLADHNIMELQKIIEVTEGINADDDLDIGEIYDNAAGLGTLDNPVVKQERIERMVRNTLEEQGYDQGDIDAYIDEIRSKYDSIYASRHQKFTQKDINDDYNSDVQKLASVDPSRDISKLTQPIPHLRFSMLSPVRGRGSDISEFIKAMNQIIDYLKSVNAYSDFTNNPNSFIDENFYIELENGEAKLNVREWQNFVREVNNRVIEYTIKETNEALGAEVNANAYYSAYKWFEAYDEIVHEVRKALMEAKNPWADGKGDKTMHISKLAEQFEDSHDMPIPDFTRKMNQGCATEFTTSIAGGQVPGSISRNGGYLKQTNQTSWLPNDRVGSIEPSLISVSDIDSWRLDYPDIDQWKCIAEGKWEPGQEAYENKTYTITTVGALLKTAQPLPDTIYIFNPEDNPHGMWVTNTPSTVVAKRRESLRLSSIIGGIVDASQEPLVLKLKKRFEETIGIVDDKGFGSRKGSKRQIGNIASNNPAVLSNVLKTAMKEYRHGVKDSNGEWIHRGFAGYLETLFEGELNDTGFGVTQARILAQGLTPCMSVVINGRARSISCETFWNEENLEAYVNNIIKNEGQFEATSYEVVVIAPSEIQSRIVKAVNEAETTARDAGSKVNTSDIKNAAYENCTTGWNGWFDEKNQLSVDEIFSRGSALGWRHRTTITPEEAATTYAKILDLDSGGKYGSVPKQPITPKRGRGVNSKTNKEMTKAINDVSDAFDIEGSMFASVKPKVLRVFLSEADKKRLSAESSTLDYWTILEQHVPKDIYWSEIGKSVGVGIVFDKDQLSSAISWSESTGNLLLVPDAVKGSLKSNRDIGGNIVQYNYTVDGENYILYDPSAIYARLEARRSIDGTSSVVPFDPDSVKGVCLDKEHTWTAGDATLQVVGKGLAQKLVDAESSKQSIRQLTGGIYGKISMINGDAADKLLAELYEEDGTPKDNEEWRKADINLTAGRFKDVSVDSLKSDIYDFLTSASNGNIDEDGFDRGNAGRNRILGIINVEAVNGDRSIVPILAPNNSPEKYDVCSVSIGNDGNIYISYYTSLETFNSKSKGQYFKASLPDMSFKGIIAVMPEETKPPTYMMTGEFKNTVNNDNNEVNLITSWDTVKSRIPGRERTIFISDLWYFSKLHGLSALYDRRGNVKQFILDQYTKDGVLDQYGLSLLLRGDKTEWNRVARGEIVLSDDYETKQIHKEIVRNYQDKIHLPYLFSPGWDWSGKRTEINIRFMLALDKSLYDYDRVLRFFHSIDQNLCPQGLGSNQNMNEFMFNELGQFHMVRENIAYWEYVKWGEPDGIGAFSELTGQATPGKESFQAFTRLAMDKGYLGRETQMALDYTGVLAGNPELYREKSIRDFATRKGDRIYSKKSSKGYNHPISSLYYATRAEREQERKIRASGDALKPQHMREVYYKGKKVDDPFAIEIEGARGNIALDALNELQGHFDSPLSREVVNGLTVYQTGYTYNDGKGSDKISLKNFADAIRNISRNITEHGLPIISTDMYDGKGRVPQPLLNREYARIIWDSCEEIQQNEKNKKDGEPDFDTFVSRMMDEQKQTDSELHSVSGKKYVDKKLECLNFSEYNWRQWGRSGQSGIIYETYSAEDIVDATNRFLEPLIQEIEDNGLSVDAVREKIDQSAKLIADGRKAADGRRFTKFAPSPTAREGKIGSQPLDHSRGYHKAFRTGIDLTKFMGVLDIFLMPSNVIYRAINQSMMSKIMSIGRKLGVVNKDFQPNQAYIKKAARNDADAHGLWVLLREAAFEGEQTEMLAFLQEGGTITEYLDMKAEQDSPLQKKYQKVRNLVYKIASGGEIGINKQLENFLNRCVYFFNEDPILRNYWLVKDPKTGMNRMETILAQDGGGAKFLREVLVKEDGNISLIAAMNAMESSRGADISQSHIGIEIFKNATNNHPVPEFLVTTLCSRFPRYSLNFMEECINLIFPMSTLRYAFTSFVAEVGHIRAEMNTDGTYVDPHYEKNLRETSLREALLVDALHWGAFGMLCILAGLPGAIEPPEDEKKWGNYKEWLILQHRVGEAWWIEDILGITVPAACFWKSVQLGKPRFDLITNGVADVCYNNPMIKVADAVEFMIDPTNEIKQDYQNMVEKYSKSPDGRTGILDYMQANATTFGLSYAAQFVTPTFIKSLTNWGTPYELDYKNVYKSNVRGVLTEKGEAGEDLVMTNYEDAMIRRLTRKNPVLALVMDITRPGTTSYSGSDFIAGMTNKMTMPYTRYLDQYQYNSMKQWSIDGLSDSDAQAKTAQIIVLLEQYQDDLDALAATGFYLDSTTKRAVSSMIWDTYYQLDSEWNEFQQSDQSDFYTLGNGDFNAGKAVYYEMKEMYQQNKREINNFYYKVMKSPELSQPMVEYRRYNTSYAQDDEGNYYATGFHPQSVLPFTSAPGTLTDPEGTAGYKNDFVTVSAVTGLPLENMRALVPTNVGEYTDWPDLKSWADDGNGEGYSKLYQSWYGTDASGSSVKNGNKNTTSTPKNTYPRYGSRGGGGGGGGGGRRSYGGGGGYTPKISGPSVYGPSVSGGLPNVSIPRGSSSRIMDVDRFVKPDQIYLRPDFETKGSREAYKRSDI